MTESEELELLELEAEEAKAKAGRPGIQPTPAPVGQGRTAVLGFAQGGTGGFADELGGLMGKFLPRALGGFAPRTKLGPAVQPAPDDTPEVRASKLQLLQREAARPTDYQLVRDAMRTEAAQAARENPKTFAGSAILGGLATTPLVPGGAAASLPRALATGAGLGAVGALGSSQADLTRGEYGQAAQDVSGVTGMRHAAQDVSQGNLGRAVLDVGGAGALGGLVTAGGGYAAGQALPTALRATRTGLENLATSAGRKALLPGATDSLSRRAPLPPEVVHEAIRSGGIVPFGTTKGNLSRLTGAVETQGDVYGSIVDELAARGIQGPNARSLADQLLARARDAELNSLNPKIAAAYRTAAERVLDASERAEQAGIATTGRTGLRQSENLKRSAQDMARYGEVSETPVNEANRNIASDIRQANEDAIAQQAAHAGGETQDVAEGFVPVKQRLGRLLEAEAAAQRGAAKASHKSLFPELASAFGPEAVLAGGASMGGHAAAALPAAVALHLLRSRGPSTAASAAYWGSRAAKGLAGLAQDWSSRGPTSALLLGAGDRALLPEQYSEWGEEQQRAKAVADALRAGAPPQ